MDLSAIIADIVQSAITKGATAITVSVFLNDKIKIAIECEGFIFPSDAECMRSLGYEYICQGEFTNIKNRIEFISDCPLGKVEDMCVSILSANPRLKEFRFIYTKNDNEYIFSRNETLVLLGDVFIGEYNVLNWIEEEIRSKINVL